MAWSPLKGSTKLKWFPKTASQVFTTGALVDVVDGFIEVCDIARQSHSGVIQKTVAATDTDYASATRLPIQVPCTPSVEWKASLLSTDTAATTDVGNFLDIGGSPVGIDVTNASSDDDAFLVSAVLDSTSAASVYAGYLNSYKPMKNGIGTAV